MGRQAHARPRNLSAAFGLTDEAEDLLCAFQDPEMLSGLLKDLRHANSRARRRRRAPGTGALTDAELAVLRLLRGPDAHPYRPV